MEVGLSRIGSLNNNRRLWIMADVQDNSLRLIRETRDRVITYQRSGRVRFVEDKIVENWVAGGVARLNVDGRANLPCDENWPDEGDDRRRRTTRKVTGKEGEKKGIR